MSKIHRITHPNPGVAKKVNFFADYFDYVSGKIGQEGFDIENHLSLVEKILWQIDTNFDNAIPYLDNYFNHPYLEEQDILLIEFRRNTSIPGDLHKYKQIKKAEGKKSWLRATPEFIEKLRSFRKSLRNRMLKQGLLEVISFLRCKHELPEHKDAIQYWTNIIISEFLLNGHSKKDLSQVFDKIMARNDEFPYPKNLQTHEEKASFLHNRTFDQQFEGILNLFSAEQKKNHLFSGFLG